MGIKDKYAICGLGVTKQGRVPGITPSGFATEAIHKAVADAGLKLSDIEGIIYQPGIGGFSATQVVYQAGLKNCKFVWQMQTGGATAIATLFAAIGAVESGAANYVVVMYSSNALSQKILVGGSGAARSTAAAYGYFGPGADHALFAQRHMHEFGTTHRQLGAIAVSQRDYANKRPDAMMYGRPMTLEDHANSRIIAEPLHMFDFCLVSDGAMAAIVTTADRARQCKSQPVYIMGLGQGHQARVNFDRTQYTTIDVEPSKTAAFREAGVTMKDIDVAELYDCFTITVLLELEAYGFCKRGEGGPYVEAGGMDIGGPGIPTNTSGNELSWGYMQGFTALTEGIRQMRGEGSGTQVKDAKTALVSGHGGGNMQYAHSTLILRR